MQWYVPLLDEFDVVAVTPRWQGERRTFEGLPQVPLVSVDQVVGRVGAVQKGLDRVFRLRSENLYYFWGLAEVLRGAAIVECLETFHPYCRQAVDLQGRFGYKLAFSAHENIAYAHENLAYRRETKRRVFAQGDAFFGLCRQGCDALILEGAPADKVHLSGAGVDVEAYSPGPPDLDALAPLGIPARVAGETTLFWAGRLVWEKGASDAICALGLLMRAGGGAAYRLLLAGDGPDLGKLRAMAARAGVADRVHFLGRVSLGQMIALYRLSDMCLVPSVPTPRWQEQFGCVLIEAMACGCPVVATRTGAIAEVVGNAGVLVAPAQHTELADAVGRLAGERAARAARGRAWVVEQYSNGVVADRIRTVYRSLLDGG